MLLPLSLFDQGLLVAGRSETLSSSQSNQRRSTSLLSTFVRSACPAFITTAWTTARQGKIRSLRVPGSPTVQLSRSLVRSFVSAVRQQAANFVPQMRLDYQVFQGRLKRQLPTQPLRMLQNTLPLLCGGPVVVIHRCSAGYTLSEPPRTAVGQNRLHYTAKAD